MFNEARADRYIASRALNQGASVEGKIGQSLARMDTAPRNPSCHSCGSVRSRTIDKVASVIGDTTRPVVPEGLHQKLTRSRRRFKRLRLQNRAARNDDITRAIQNEPAARAKRGAVFNIHEPFVAPLAAAMSKRATEIDSAALAIRRAPMPVPPAVVAAESADGDRTAGAAAQRASRADHAAGFHRDHDCAVDRLTVGDGGAGHQHDFRTSERCRLIIRNEHLGRKPA